MRKAVGITLMLSVCCSQVTKAEELTYGEAEYLNSCVVCHGEYGRGDGPLADEMRTAPADLTTLSRSNGGEFPYWKVFALIDGRSVVPAHGSREMPVWGNEFLTGDVAKYGRYCGEAITQDRIHALSAYIATLQR